MSMSLSTAIVVNFITIEEELIFKPTTVLNTNWKLKIIPGAEFSVYRLSMG